VKVVYRGSDGGVTGQERRFICSEGAVGPRESAVSTPNTPSRVTCTQSMHGPNWMLPDNRAAENVALSTKSRKVYDVETWINQGTRPCTDHRYRYEQNSRQTENTNHAPQHAPTWPNESAARGRLPSPPLSITSSDSANNARRASRRRRNL
jgi:hypothetical protein